MTELEKEKQKQDCLWAHYLQTMELADLHEKSRRIHMTLTSLAEVFYPVNSEVQNRILNAPSMEDLNAHLADLDAAAFRLRALKEQCRAIGLRVS